MLMLEIMVIILGLGVDIALLSIILQRKKIKKLRQEVIDANKTLLKEIFDVKLECKKEIFDVKIDTIKKLTDNLLIIKALDENLKAHLEEE